jgi:hypothetical protein
MPRDLPDAILAMASAPIPVSARAPPIIEWWSIERIPKGQERR